MRFILSICLMALLTLPAMAQQQLGGIVATVNDDVITANDVQGRMALAMMSSNLPNTDEVRQRLAPQIMRSLVDEQLQRQQAERDGVKVSAEEIEDAVAKLAQNNNVPPDQMDELFASRGVPMSALRNQVESALLWNKVVTRRLRPLVEVGEEEVDARLEQMRANAGKQEYLVAEIFLRVDNPDEEMEVQGFAYRLLEQIQGGANFAVLAQQFSQGAGALQGGDLGWVTQGQLTRELDQALADLGGNGITQPIKDSAGYHILLVRDIRRAAGVDPENVSVTLAQVLVPQSDNLDKTVKRARSSAKSCKSLEGDMTAIDKSIRVKQLPEKKVDDLPDWLRGLVQSLTTNEVSDAYALDNGALLVMLCDRTVSGDGGPSRDDIISQIGQERLELQARRLMRDLRSEAVIDVRS